MENEVQKAEFFKVQKIPAEVEKSSGKKVLKNTKKNINLAKSRNKHCKKEFPPEGKICQMRHLFLLEKKCVQTCFVEKSTAKNINNVK